MIYPDREFKALSDINVTSLVDVTLVLLIIFLITAPIMRAGLEVDLPESKATGEVNLEQGLTVTITKDGVVIIESRPVPLEEFRSEMEVILLARDVEEVYLQGDKAVPYGIVMKVVGELRELGVTALGLVAEPESLERRRGRR